VSEAEQSAQMQKKYGGLPSRKGILNKRMKGQTDRTFFDSADHFSGKETGSQKKQPSPNNTDNEETTADNTTQQVGASSSSGSSDSVPPQGTSTSSSVEATQTAKLSNKYGGLPSKKGILNKRLKGQNERTYFDSADHFSGKETGSQNKKSPLKGNPALSHLKK